MLTALAGICLLIGVVLLIVGFTVNASAQRPAWALLVIALVLYVIAVLLPYIHTVPAAMSFV